MIQLKLEISFQPGANATSIAMLHRELSEHADVRSAWLHYETDDES